MNDKPKHYSDLQARRQELPRFGEDDRHINAVTEWERDWIPEQKRRIRRALIRLWRRIRE